MDKYHALVPVEISQSFESSPPSQPGGTPSSAESSGRHVTVSPSVATVDASKAECILQVEHTEFEVMAQPQVTGQNVAKDGYVATDSIVPSIDQQRQSWYSETDVTEMIKLSAKANKVTVGGLVNLTTLIMGKLDPENTGYVRSRELEALMEKVVDVVKRPLESNEGPMNDKHIKRRGNNLNCLGSVFYHSSSTNGKRMMCLLLWAGANLGVFTWQFRRFEHKSTFEVLSYCVCTAKGFAEVLKLNTAFALLPVCRSCLRWLRSTWLSNVIPFDDNVNFHKLTALAIIFGTIGHGGVHVTCNVPRIVNADHALFERTIGLDWKGRTQPNWGWFLTSAEVLSGIFITVLIFTASIFATKWFRRSLIKLPRPCHTLPGFNVFCYSHHLFIAVYILLIFHGTHLIFTNDWTKETTWMYVAIPVLLYCGERIHRSYRITQCKVMVLKAPVYAGNVLALYISKPQKFVYRSGMYMYVKCPDVSSLEWHPFSITSAPGDEILSIHVRALGDWTKDFQALFRHRSESVGDRSSDESLNLPLSVNFPRVYIDGPYGAPAQDYTKYDVVLLVGLGIGATPFISILKDMVNNVKASPANKDRKSKQKLRSAYFYWVTREQGSFDWFRSVMAEVEEIDNRQIIEMHNYLTSVYEEGDPRSAMLVTVQTLQYYENSVDVMSGNRSRTHFGRPNWNKVFSGLSCDNQNNEVGVFYCGPPGLGTELYHLSRKFSLLTSTKFEFHKENF